AGYSRVFRDQAESAVERHVADVDLVLKGRCAIAVGAGRVAPACPQDLAGRGQTHDVGPAVSIRDVTGGHSPAQDPETLHGVTLTQDGLSACVDVEIGAAAETREIPVREVLDPGSVQQRAVLTLAGQPLSSGQSQIPPPPSLSPTHLAPALPAPCTG